jgi:hypothetical protein
MTVCGKQGKTMKLFSHPSHRPWKSLHSDSHIPHRLDDHGMNISQTFNVPGGGPKQTAEMGQTSLPNA